MHCETQLLLSQLISHSSGHAEPINVMLNANLRQKVRENREKLVSIVDTIKLCGHLAISLRGHRDDSQYHAEVGAYSSNQVGNFLELKMQVIFLRPHKMT